MAVAVAVVAAVAVTVAVAVGVACGSGCACGRGCGHGPWKRVAFPGNVWRCTVLGLQECILPDSLQQLFKARACFARLSNDLRLSWGAWMGLQNGQLRTAKLRSFNF